MKNNGAIATLLAALAALVVILVIFTTKAHAGEPRTYTTPNGLCNVYELGVSPVRTATVICTSNVPDITGDGLPEEEYRVLELGRYGRLRCASSIILDPTCPSNGTCIRYLYVDRTCF